MFKDICLLVSIGIMLFFGILFTIFYDFDNAKKWFRKLLKRGYTMKHGLGLIKSIVSPADYIVKTFLTEDIRLTELDLTDSMTPVRNQGSEGSCAGFATAVGVKEYQEQIDYGHRVSLSPRYIYEKAKIISKHTEGTTLKACMEVITKDGVCEDKLWPYIAKDVGSPAPNAAKNAEKFKILNYARITNIEELKQALIQFGATLIGITVFKGMMSDACNKTGIVPDPNCFERMNVLGGHALCAVGFNDKSPYYKNDGHIKFKNSWGEEWGEKGYGYLSYKYITKNMLDAFSCVDIDDPHPIRVMTLTSFEMKKAIWL